MESNKPGRRRGQVFFPAVMRPFLAVLICAAAARPAAAQFEYIETDHLRLVYFGGAQSYLVRHVARTFENALLFHENLYGYATREPVTVVVHDFSDFGNAGADVLPRNRITVAIAPLSYAFETSPANERMNATMNHELVHIVASDQAAGRDLVFRKLFLGKVKASEDDPLSMIYSYLTAPRRYAPRWYHEGIAVFLETWMAGGLGRALGGYDEMVFRTMVEEGAFFYDALGLESEGTGVDFHVGVNSYLYGTRFMSYLALRHGPERVIQWTSRPSGSEGHFGAQFSQSFGMSLRQAWSEWIEWEREFQAENLNAVRSNSVTPYRSVTRQALGSVSRACYDHVSNSVYVAVNYPGQIAHIAKIDLKTGEMRRIVDVKGATLFTVSSLALDDSSRTLFYTTDNDDWRDLHSVDLNTGQTRLLIKDVRVGDLAFNKLDRSLWGVRHFNGISTIVRIPHPYEEWNQVYSWNYGRDMYEIDLSPDGRLLSGALAEIDGRQSLVLMHTDSLLAGRYDHEELFDFDVSNPANFAFSHDGKYLVGSSYYSGVSNIYRFDLDARRMVALTNAETGFFRPVAIASDSLFAFRYTAKGFLPVMIPAEPVQRVGAIRFLGNEIAEQHPVVRDWIAGRPGEIDLEAMTRRSGPYHGLKHLRLTSVYPIIQGYKDQTAVGLRLDLSDPVGLYNLKGTVSVSPGSDIAADERIHASAEYLYRNWGLSLSHNGADFYDLFGPTKSSRKGTAAGVSYRRSLIFDSPRALSLTTGVSGYWGLERMPEYQNVAASFSEFYTAHALIKYENLRASLGAVDYEKGVSWSVATNGTLVRQRVFPRVHATISRGFPLPIRHSSLWIRGAAGVAIGDRDESFANFYFGGFGNNWVDYQEIKRFQQVPSFAGIDLNAVGGRTFTKAQAEWALPAVKFRRAGLSMLYLKWMRPTLFTSMLLTDFESEDFRHEAVNGGLQMDFRIMLFSYLRTTLSLGAAAARSQGVTDEEWMVSLKIM